MNRHFPEFELISCAPTCRILVDWLIELYDELHLSAEVLLDGVYHVDRFLSSQTVAKDVS